MSTTFQISRTQKGEYHFKLLNSNGKTLLRSEGYNARSGCTNGIESVRKNAGDESHYDSKTASDGRAYFNLKASNGQIIGTSPMFTDAPARDAAIAAMKQDTSAAPVQEQA